MRTVLLCLLALAGADAASVNTTNATCAEAYAKSANGSLCPGDSILKAEAGEISCSTYSGASTCTQEKCCHPRAALLTCLFHSQCTQDGDRDALCLHERCQCTSTANYITRPPDSRNVQWAGCVLNRVWFTLVFPHGNFDLLTVAHRAAITNATGTLLKKLRWIQFSRGSIVVSGEAETIFGTVSHKAIDAAVQGAVPESVLGATMRTAYDMSDPRLNSVGSLCLSTDPGAFEARMVNVSGRMECLPTRCNNTGVNTGYAPVPIAHTCVLFSHLEDGGLSTGAKAGIALGAFVGVAVCAAIVVIVVVRSRKSAAASGAARSCASNEPAAEPKCNAAEAARSCASNEPAAEPKCNAAEAVVVDAKEARLDALERAVSDAAEKLAAAKTEVAAARLALRNDEAAANSEALASLETQAAGKDARIADLEHELARLRALSGADAERVSDAVAAQRTEEDGLRDANVSNEV